MGDEARDIIRRAEKASRGGFFSIFSGGPNYDEASQLYVAAANKHKMAKEWQPAAECFIHAAFLQQKLQDQNQEARYFVEAADLMKKYSTNDAVEYYNRAADIYNLQGRFGQSAKLMKGTAELFESEGNNKESLKFYKKAADYFEIDDYGKSAYTQCTLKYAELIAKQQNNYEEAIKIFEKEGEKALRNSLIQFGAKEHFLKAGILHLVVGDEVSAKIACEGYEEIDPRFSTSREGKLLRVRLFCFIDFENMYLDCANAAVFCL